MPSRCWKFGDNISTDEILPSRFMTLIEPAELAGHILSGTDPDFPQKFKPGDIIVAGENFGYGSSREQAALALKSASARAIIAKSFARIFFRNSINLGLPLIVCPEAVDGIKQGDEVEIDLNKQTVYNLSSKQNFVFQAYPDFILELLEKGGLIEVLNEKSSTP